MRSGHEVGSVNARGSHGDERGTLDETAPTTATSPTPAGKPGRARIGPLVVHREEAASAAHSLGRIWKPDGGRVCSS